MKPTEQQLQDIYEEAVSAECAENQGEEMATFDLMCKLDEIGGLAHFIRNMIDVMRAPRVFIDGSIAEGDMDKLLSELKNSGPGEIIPVPQAKNELPEGFTNEHGRVNAILGNGKVMIGDVHWDDEGSHGVYFSPVPYSAPVGHDFSPEVDGLMTTDVGAVFVVKSPEVAPLITLRDAVDRAISAFDKQ